MTNWPPYNPYANCCAPCGYNPNANCASNNTFFNPMCQNALNADDIIEKLRPKACEPNYRRTDDPPCRDYQLKYDFRNNGEIYEIVAVQEPDE